MDERLKRRPGRRRRWLRSLLLGGAVVGVPALAHALLQRRARPPQAPRWGRARRYAGRTGRIVFQELGSGSPLVLLHSFGPGHDASEWEAVAETLAEQHSVYAPDLPGWGRSDPPAFYRPQAYMRAIEDFLAGVVRERAVVVAAGPAAGYALEAALDQPALLRALALVTPVGLEPEPALSGAAAVALRRLFATPVVGASALDLLTSRGALAHRLRREVYAAPERVDAALVERHYRASHHPEHRRTLAAYWSGRLRPDLTALPRPDLPVWIAWGSAAVRPAVTGADLWLDKLPQAELEVFPGCGLLPHAEAPAAFCRALDRFLERLPE